MLNTAIKSAKESSKILLNHFKKPLKIQEKMPSDIVTNADLESEKAIINIIKQKYPHHSIYSEEAGFIDRKSHYVWYIDPLDGTHNYSRNVPIFGTSIGLLHKEEPLLGVIAIPYMGLFLYAERNKGAFLNGKRVQVSTKELSKAGISIPSPFKRYKPIIHIMKSISQDVQIMTMYNCISFNLTQIAIGECEGFVSDESKMHDVLAGVIIIREAGGKVTDWEGKEWSTKSKNIIATNYMINDRIISSLSKNKRTFDR